MIFSRYTYSVSLENCGWNALSKRAARRHFRAIKLPLGESAALTRTHKRTGRLDILATRYQPDEEKAAQYRERGEQ